MVVAVCTGCHNERPIKAKGLCNPCYVQLKRTGSLERVRMPRGQCTAPGCEKQAHGRGLCDMHLRRLRVSGSLDDPRADNANLMTNQRLYAQWSQYQRGDAIPMYQPWKENFFAFMEGVGERPSLDHRLHRIDKNRPMGPGNFEWRKKLVTKLPGESAAEYDKRHRFARRTVLGVGSWNSDLRSKYGQDFGLRELQTMAEKQNHCCAICGKPEKEMRNGAVKHLAVDHDHKTGKVRELLCTACNKGLGHFDDDIDLMIKAIAYLRKHRGAA